MKLISSEERYRTPIFWVTQDRALDPDGFEIHRAIVQHHGSAVMMPVDEKGRILLVRQYRLPARGYLWELPAGRLDPGESVLKAARRELAGEAGRPPRPPGPRRRGARSGSRSPRARAKSPRHRP